MACQNLSVPELCVALDIYMNVVGTAPYSLVTFGRLYKIDNEFFFIKSKYFLGKEPYVTFSECTLILIPKVEGTCNFQMAHLYPRLPVNCPFSKGGTDGIEDNFIHLCNFNSEQES